MYIFNYNWLIECGISKFNVTRGSISYRYCNIFRMVFIFYQYIKFLSRDSRMNDYFDDFDYLKVNMSVKSSVVQFCRIWHRIDLINNLYEWYDKVFMFQWFSPIRCLLNHRITTIIVITEITTTDIQ